MNIHVTVRGLQFSMRQIVPPKVGD